MSSKADIQQQKSFISQNTKKLDDLSFGIQPRTYQDDEFLQQTKFNLDEVKTIRKTYIKHAYKEDLMNRKIFRSSLGILGMDNACFLADRIFDLIDSDKNEWISFMDFLKYLDVIMNRDDIKKAQMSFQFIDRENKGRILYEDIQYLIQKVALFWKELTGQIVVPQRQHIDEIFRALDPKNTGEVRLSDFQKMYYNQDCYFQWFEFFNQDELTENKIAKIENEEIVKQKDQLLKLQIEANLKNIEQEIVQLTVQLNKVSSKFKELLQKEHKNTVTKLKQKQVPLIKLQQVQQKQQSNQSTSRQVQQQQQQQNANYIQLNKSSNQIDLGSATRRQKIDQSQDQYQSNNLQEKKKDLNNLEKNKKNVFEHVVNQGQTFNQSKRSSNIQTQSSPQEKRNSIQKNGENTVEFQSNSSTSSILINSKKFNQNQQQINDVNLLKKFHPSIDFSTSSTMTLNLLANMKLQQPHSNGRISIFNQNNVSLDQIKAKQSVVQPVHNNLEQSNIKNSSNLPSYRNQNIITNQSVTQNYSQRNSGAIFDQSAYYELNNFKAAQKQKQEQSNSCSFSILSCGGLKDVAETKSLEAVVEQKTNRDESSTTRTRRKHKIFDQIAPQRSQELALNFLSFNDQQGQQQLRQVNNKEKIFNTSAVIVSNNSNITKEEAQNNKVFNNQFQNQTQNNKIVNNQNQTQNFDKSINNSFLNQQTPSNNNNKQLENQQQNIKINLNSAVPQHNQNLNKQDNYAKIYQNSQKELNDITEDLNNQIPIFNGPLKIELPTDQNLGDTDPLSEDETDYRNNRPFQEAKFQVLEHQNSIISNNSPKRDANIFDTKQSPISGISSQSDVIQNLIKRNNQTNSSLQSPYLRNPKLYLENSYSEFNSQPENLKQPLNDYSQYSEAYLDQESEFKSNIENNLQNMSAVEYIAEEYKKIEKQIQGYIELIADYQKQLAELEEKMNTNKIVKYVNKNGNKKIQELSQSAIREESFQNSLESYQFIQNQKDKPQTKYNQLNSITNFLQPESKVQNNNHNLVPHPVRFSTCIPQISNFTSNAGLVRHKSIAIENSFESINQNNLRKSTIKNMPAVLSDKQKKQNLDRKRNLQLYIGHQNWNLVLEMMLVIRSAIKSLKQINHPAFQNHGQQGTNNSSMFTEGNQNVSQLNGNTALQNQSSYYQNNQINLFHQNSQYIPLNQQKSNNINNNNLQVLPLQSTFSYLENQSSVFPDKKTFSNFPNLSAIYGNSMAAVNLNLELKPKDFMTNNQQLLFNTISNNNYQFANLEYIDYCPLVFESIRRSSNISHEKFLRSLGPENLIGNLIMGRMSQISELCRSSNKPYKKFQYYSECGSFIVKIIQEQSAKNFLKVLPQYHQYITSQPNSLLMRIYGLYKLQTRKDNTSNKRNSSSFADQQNVKNQKQEQLEDVYFIVCQNIFNTNLSINHRFEIKGSTKGRKAEKKNTPRPDQTLPRKDKDWINSNIKIRVDLKLKQQILDQLQSDSQFLSDNKIFNYCALIGVHSFEKYEDANQYDLYNSNYSSQMQTNQNQNEQNNQTASESTLSKIQSIDRKQVFFLGIINIFTEYTASKKIIAAIKNSILGGQQSTVDPQTYSNRFLSFFQQNVLD
ncbi:phosphatidylinositol 4-phosphate 5-kinase (macronuclear) [Tetrahymena thermophila SB210]|uniref:Phosphatidylinositol 4-phosphate 5-kinase n=1 Tax=Tetrahymena thermophila (strain SB210) TaxID=312017 RepID=Q22C61_TETTS|nr:phosphatidylinositol 4-phosphate 5-kinase [Tetrahymena thermophila SB210]EAR82895.1 phosphatidylinositol 4-phosphate 5-kinase [Tetrahymena thermophila SB210]|eukprot:XP_001030558.1 phosphatidylinositol 4-phosphate 5-kinase [Tetrahymena thermophila SB210]